MDLHWVVFGAVWAGLVVAGFIFAGAVGENARERLNRDTSEFDLRRAHLVHLENSTQLFIITILLAGILAALVALLLR